MIRMLPVLMVVPLLAQRPLEQEEVSIFFESGEVTNQHDQRAVVFAESIQVTHATWLRLHFSHVTLGEPRPGGSPTQIRITSTLDGASQILDSVSLDKWRHSTAYFNGDELTVEVIADPDSGPSEIRINTVIKGLPQAVEESICGPNDDRLLSSDDRSARVVPIGCTVWLFNDANRCFLTAGHCMGGMEVVEFNVPLSNSNGSINHPPPEDQYPVDPTSVQGTNGGTGNDYAYFGCFENTTTGLTAFEAQGVAYTLGSPPAVPSGETIRISGYGTTTGTQGTPLTWSQVQTTHTGPIASVVGNLVRYSVDTTGGDSGSCVFNENTGLAIGIHTHAGCNSGGGSNQGTNLDHPGLQQALANPLGVCAPPPPLEITFPSGIPALLDPAGTVIDVQIEEINGGIYQSGSAMLVYDAGSGDVTVPMTSARGGLSFQATFPAIACASQVRFYVTAQDTLAVGVTHPSGAPAERHIRAAALGFYQSFQDDFESDMGWTVQNDGGLSDGAWERGVPMGGGVRADPPWDGDSSGSCYLTDNAPGNSDVDGGHTRLMSPLLDVSADPDPHVVYWRWWSDQGSSDDQFLIEISDDDGSSWVTLETIGPNVNGGWVFRVFRIADFVTPNNQIRVRFDASDTGGGDVVEAGVDGFAIYRSNEGFTCSACSADINGDLVVDEDDLYDALAGWPGPGLPDLNTDGVHNLLDLLTILSDYGVCD